MKYEPLTHTIQAALGSVHPLTAKNYRPHIFRFIQHLEDNASWDKVPANVFLTWTPFIKGASPNWDCNEKVPAPILNEVTPELRDGFLEQFDYATSTIAYMKSAIHRLMTVAQERGQVDMQIIAPLQIGANRPRGANKPLANDVSFQVALSNIAPAKRDV